MYAAYQIAAVPITLTYLGNCTSALHQISVPVIHGRGSILSGGVALRPALCTSVFIDVVICAHNWPHGGVR